MHGWLTRVAAAPISWGVCEVPGWGLMLPAQDVLAQMRSLGLTATELGAPGFLPWEPEALAATLDAYGMSLVGGFVPLVLHRPEALEDSLAQADATARLFQRCGATRFVTAAVVDAAWTRPTPLDADGMRHLAEGLRRVDDVCERRGLVQVLHPHVGTLVETAADVERALEHTDARWCLDTGHLAIGGLDPLQFARDAGDRVEHVHLKDVDLRVAARVRSGEISLMRAVQTGLFTVLGDGDIPVDEVVLALERAGYSGWYVLEQDIALAAAPPPPPDGPIMKVSRCLEYLTSRVAPRIPVSSH